MGETFAYLKKSFWLLAAAIAVPSIAACFLYSPYWEVSFVSAIEYPIMPAAKTFGILFGDWRYLWPIVVVSALQIFASAYAMSAIDRHFRTGKLSFRSPWRLINYSVFSIFLGVLIMSLVSVFLRFVLFGLVMLVQVIAEAAGLVPGATLAVIALIAVGFFVIHIAVITPMLYLAPIMFIYGYGFRDAAGMSFKLISGKKVFAGLLLPMMLCAGIQLLVGFLKVHVSISIVVGFVIFMFTNIYVVAYVPVTFYHISGLDRRDVKPYASFVLPAPKPAPAAEPSAEKAAAKVKAHEEKPEKTEKTKPTAAKSKPTEEKPSPQEQGKSAQVRQNTPARKPSARSAKTVKRVKPRAEIAETAPADVNTGISQVEGTAIEEGGDGI